MRLYKLQLDPSAIDKCAMVFVPPLASEKRRNWDILLTPLRNLQTCSIFSGFYQWRMIDDNRKRFILHLAIDIDFFHSAFVNPCIMYCKTKGAVRAVCALRRICLFSAYWLITVWDDAIALKGSHPIGDGRIFLKSLRDTSFNKDLLNEPNFGWIRLAEQYL